MHHSYHLRLVFEMCRHYLVRLNPHKCIFCVKSSHLLGFIGGHQHIIVAVDCFTKWAEAMPTIKSDGETAAHFVFNQIITRFGIPKELVTDHGRHFQNHMMEELASKLRYNQDHSSSYYPQVNG